jgi:hypothetical protein
MFDLKGWLSDRFRKESIVIVQAEIPKERVHRSDGKPSDDREIVAGQHYVQIWLSDLSLKYARDWFKSRYAAVYSLVEVDFGRTTQQISHVAGQSNLPEPAQQGAAADLGMNYKLTGIVPFNGGSIAFEAGLVAMEARDDVKAFLDSLHEFSKLLVVPQLSAALAVASPLAAGISKLVGAAGNLLLLRYHDAWTGIVPGSAEPNQPGAGNPLRAGYYAVVAADAKTFPADQLRVKSGRLRIGPDEASSKPLTGYDYMLFRVDRLESRSDWDKLTTIQEPYEEAIGLLKQSIYDAENHDRLIASAKQRLAQARLAALRSQDLTRPVGSRQVITKLQEEFDEALRNVGAGAAEFAPSTSLNEVLQDLMPPAVAASLPAIQERDLWIGSDS